MMVYKATGNSRQTTYSRIRMGSQRRHDDDDDDVHRTYRRARSTDYFYFSAVSNI